MSRPLNLAGRSRARTESRWEAHAGCGKGLRRQATGKEGAEPMAVLEEGWVSWAYFHVYQAGNFSRKELWFRAWNLGYGPEASMLIQEGAGDPRKGL